MSGTNQHFIPQMLLKAFRLGHDGKFEPLRVFQSDKNFNRSVRKIAAEHNFYSGISTDGTETLDDVITLYENKLASDLKELNNSTSPVSATTAARVVTHLFIRNDHLRGIMRSGASGVLGLMKDLFGSDEKIAQLIGINDFLPGPQFNKVFAEHIASDPTIQASGIPVGALMQLAHIMLRETSVCGFGGTTHMISHVMAQFSEEIPQQVRASHAKILTSSLEPPQWTQSLQRFDWSIEEQTNFNFILPDFVALAGR